MKLLGYTRVSTREQAEEGHSLAAQRYRLQAYAVANESDLVEVFEDPGQSGSSIDRPGLQAALQALRDGKADGLVVTKLDRLTRSVKDFNHLLDEFFTKGYVLASLGDSINTSNASGRLVLNVLLSVFQWERESIAERVTEGLAQAKREGKRLGRPPRVVDSRVLELHKQGLSLRKIAAATGEDVWAVRRAVQRAAT